MLLYPTLGLAVAFYDDDARAVMAWAFNTYYAETFAMSVTVSNWLW